MGRGPEKRRGRTRGLSPPGGVESEALRRQFLLEVRCARDVLERDGHRLGAAIDFHLAEELQAFRGGTFTRPPSGCFLNFTSMPNVLSVSFGPKVLAFDCSESFR
jgi:hypothetical protein